MDSKKCIVCDSYEFKPIYSDRLLKCGNCSFVTANVNSAEQVLKNPYTENYFKGEAYYDYLRVRISRQINFKHKLNLIYKKVNKKEIKSVLEIGCAYGFFAQLFTEEFGKSSTYAGIDIIKEAIDYGVNELGQNLVYGNYLDYVSDKKYTDVFMWDVIEHLAEPEKFIKKMSNECVDGGRLYIYTQDISAIVPRVRGSRWRNIHTSDHIHYFSNKTIKILLEKYGFTVFDISYPSVYRNVKQSYYYLFMLNKRYSKIVKFIFDLIPENLTLPVNTYDNMLVMARKCPQ